ncbi:hypothetical protein EN792_006285 [Mesorhizobium sp. M00.F.Ca.ET.149.01.1.1]|nr:hypothetical protein EN792_006285 [Mesorhizobium sp. M00.F.Ca.ET.149.01.1.1]
MAKLPPIEVRAILARDELHRGKAHREKALAFLAEAGDGPLAQELRAAVSKRGRQPFGAKHRWWEIGVDNDDLRDIGMGYEERRIELAARYMLDVTQIATALGKYERAIEEIRAAEGSPQG